MRINILVVIAFLSLVWSLPILASTELPACLQPNGNPVPIFYSVDNCRETACAQIRKDGKEWRITINPTQFAMFPALMQRFIMLHECGHLNLGHRQAGNVAYEVAADCWAMNAASKKGFSKKDRNDIVNFMRSNSDKHLYRANALYSCVPFYSFK